MITRVQNNQLNSTKSNKMQSKNNTPAFGINLGKFPDALWQEAKTKNLLPEAQIKRFEAMLNDEATKHLTLDTFVTKDAKLHLGMFTSQEDSFRPFTIVHTATPQLERPDYHPVMGTSDFFFPKPYNRYEVIPPKTSEEIAQDQVNEIKNVLFGLTPKKVTSIDEKVLQDKKSAKNWKKIEALINHAQEKTPKNRERQRLKLLLEGKGNDLIEILKKSFQKTGVTQKDVKKMNNLVTDTSLKGMTIRVPETKKIEQRYSWIYSSKKQGDKTNRFLFRFYEKSQEKMNLVDSIRSVFQPQKYFLAEFLRSLTPQKLLNMEKNPKYVTQEATK